MSDELGPAPAGSGDRVVLTAATVVLASAAAPVQRTGTGTFGANISARQSSLPNQTTL